MQNKFYGYGVDLSQLIYKNLDTFVRKYTPDEWEDMIEDFKENQLTGTDTDILEWLSNYENDGYYGLSAYLSSIIHEQEDINISAYDSVQNGYLYIVPNYPWRFNMSMRELTIESYKNILKTYISQITDCDIIVEDLVMYYDDIDN